MVQIVKAEWKRNAVIDGTPVSEVEVWVAGETRPWNVYMEKTGDYAFAVRRIVRNQADYDIDWYDNDLHQAFAEVTEEAMPATERGGFALSVAELAQLQAFAE